MFTFSRDDLLKVAKLSALKLNDKEIEQFAEELKQILQYSTMLDKVVSTEQIKLNPFKTNTFREDQIEEFDSKIILDDAPAKKDTSFVVPKIL